MRGLLALVLGLFATALLANQAVHEYKLDNGLKLIVKEDHRAPIMVSQVWYKVGSSYEHDGITGISHVLEHMMFKGTKAHPNGEFSEIIAENADRMRNLTIPDDEVMKEVKVVMEERRMRTEDNPQSLTYEQFKATAYASSPYRIPIIGWMDDLENLQVDDLREWYRMWYAPNNATLVVVGDVDPDEVYAQAKKHFGPLKPSKIAPVKPRLEITQRGRKDIQVEAPAKLPYLIMGYKAPVVLTAEQDWEPYALDVLAGILDGGDSARLASELVRGKAIAASAGASYDGYDRLQTLFLLSGTPATGHTMADLEKALLEQVKQVREKPATGKELDRVKAQLRASKVYEQDSIFYQAMQMGMLETVGLGWKDADTYLERIEAVTADQVQAVARKYLLPERLTVAKLVPQPIDPKNPPRTGGAGHVR